MSKTNKVLKVLYLFDDQHQQLHIHDIARCLGISAATAYRYVDELIGVQLLERLTANTYVLGPGIVRLDRQIREHDPLIRAAQDIMRGLAERTGGTTLLVRAHGLMVMCLHQIRGRYGPASVSYERGKIMPLFKGATSKVILAHLDDASIRHLATKEPASLRNAGFPTRPDLLRAHLLTLRNSRVIHTCGEVDEEAMGWAVPIYFHDYQFLGSLSIVLSGRTPNLVPPWIVEQLVRAALRLQGRLEQQLEGTVCVRSD